MCDCDPNNVTRKKNNYRNLCYDSKEMRKCFDIILTWFAGRPRFSNSILFSIFVVLFSDDDDEWWWWTLGFFICFLYSQNTRLDSRAKWKKNWCVCLFSLFDDVSLCLAVEWRFLSMFSITRSKQPKKKKINNENFCSKNVQQICVSSILFSSQICTLQNAKLFFFLTLNQNANYF